MPTAITLHAAAIWFVVGFVVGLGWTLASWLLGRVLSYFPRR